MTGIELRDLLVEWGVSGGTMASALSQLGYSAEPATIRAWHVVPPPSRASSRLGVTTRHSDQCHVPSDRCGRWRRRDDPPVPPQDVSGRVRPRGGQSGLLLRCLP